MWRPVMWCFLWWLPNQMRTYLGRLLEMCQKVAYLGTLSKRIVIDLRKKLFKGLNLEGIELWTEQQQQSVEDLLTEYQHLFAMNLSELCKTSLAQHDIKLDDPTPFKEKLLKNTPKSI